MSTIEIDGYIIDIEENSIDFSNIADFDINRLDSIFEPRSQTRLYVNPRLYPKWGTWSGKKFMIGRKPRIAYLHSNSKLICRYDTTPPAD